MAVNLVPFPRQKFFVIGLAPHTSRGTQHYITNDGDLSNDADEVKEGMDDIERYVIKGTRSKLDYMRYK